MRQHWLFNTRSRARAGSAGLALALLSSCAGAPVKGPHVQVCFVQAERGGIECALEDNRTVFLRWDQIKDNFMAGFDKQVLLTREGFSQLLAWGHRK